MKKTILMLMTGFMLTAFSIPEHETPVTGELTELRGYKLRSNDIDKSDFNLWVVTNEDAFNKDFVPENDSVLKPNFDEQLVLAAKVETYNYSYQVKYRKLEVVNGSVNVYFTVRKVRSGHEAGGPVSMLVLPKDRSYKKVNFYHDNMLVKAVPIVTVY